MRRNPVDFSLYLVIDGDAENPLDIVKQAIKGGVTVVQLREKRATTREIFSLGQELLKKLRPLGVPLIINDRVDIAHALCANGVHLGQSDLAVSAARAILGPQAIIGLSVETIEQAISAQKEEIDYLAISPLFFTPSKTDCKTEWGLEGLQRVCQLSRHPVIAIGGIHEANVESVMARGAAGVAVISAIFNASSPFKAALELKQRIQKT